MCYHKSLKADIKAIEKYYDADARDLSYSPTYYENGFDFKPGPILTTERPKEILMYNWGFVPWWSKTMQDGLRLRTQTLNCISEEMYDKPSFRDAAKESKRCLIPCTGFTEWRWMDERGKNKIPYYVHSPNQAIFSIAGLYSRWHNKGTGEEFLSYTVLTTAANEFMSMVHNSKRRMPAIIKKEFERDWLNENLSKDDVLALCKSMPDDFLVGHTINKKISGNKLSTDEKNIPSIYEEVKYDEAIESNAPVEKPTKAKATRKPKDDQSQQSLF